MLYLIDPAGNYYEAEHNVTGATEIPVQRPGPEYDWTGENWVINEERRKSLVLSQLEESRKSKASQLQMAYTIACSLSVIFTTEKGVTSIFQAGKSSVAALNNALLGWQFSEKLPDDYFWVDEDNTPVPFTYSDLKGLAATIAEQNWAAFQHLQSLKAELKQATSLDQINSITW